METKLIDGCLVSVAALEIMSKAKHLYVGEHDKSDYGLFYNVEDAPTSWSASTRSFAEQFEILKRDGVLEQYSKFTIALTDSVIQIVQDTNGDYTWKKILSYGDMVGEKQCEYTEKRAYQLVDREPLIYREYIDGHVELYKDSEMLCGGAFTFDPTLPKAN